jgi:hypothetical protein
MTTRKTFSVVERMTTRDEMLGVPTAAQWAAYFAQRAPTDLGVVWDGNMKSALDAMSTRDAVKAAATHIAAMQDYIRARDDDFDPSGSLRPAPYGALKVADNAPHHSSSSGKFFRRQRDETGAVLADMNAKAKEIYQR